MSKEKKTRGSKTLKGKQRPLQHRIDEKGKSIFRLSLPDTEEFEMAFSEEALDYGIDGQLQIFRNGKHTGEFPKVQLKSKGKATYLKDKRTLSFPLDLESASFLIEQVQDPTALIVIDNDKKAAFWYPIQTSTEARAAFDKALVNSQAKKPSITLRIDTQSNLLTPKNYQGLHDYLRAARVKLSRSAILRDKTNQTLATGLNLMSDIEQQTIELEGYTPHIRRENDPMTPGAVFSIGHRGGRTIDYVPSKDFRPDLLPKVKLKAKFSKKTKEGQKKYEAFKKAVEEGKGSITLTSENIESFEAVSGKRILDDSTFAKGGTKLVLEPSIQKNRLTIFVNNGSEELENTVETWVLDGEAHMESIAGQAMHITGKFKVPKSNKTTLKTTLKIRINPENLGSASQALRLMDFLRNARQMEISLLDPEGFKRKLFGGLSDYKKMFTEENYQFTKALAETEQKSGVPIPYPLPDKLKREDINNVFWVHRLLTQGKISQDVTLNFSLKDEKSKNLKQGGAIMITQNPPEIYLFGKPYVMLGFKHVVKGIISDLETVGKQEERKFKAKIKDAEISLEKTGKIPNPKANPRPPKSLD